VISSHLPDLVDSYIATRAQRLVKDKEAAQIKQAEDDLWQIIVSKMRTEGMSACGGTNGLVKMTKNVEPVALDWPATWKFIKENDAWELMHKRLTSTAVKERWEAGEEIPGVGRTDVYKLSVSKL